MKNLFTQTILAAAVMLSVAAPFASADVYIGDKKCTNLGDAFGKVRDGETITVSGSEDCTWTINPVANVNITIQGENNATINIKRRASDNTFRVFCNLNQDGSGVTIKDLTIAQVETDETGKATAFSGNLIQQQYGKLYMENVIVKGFATTAPNGAIRIYGKAVSSGLKNVAFEDCTIPNNYNVFCAKGGYSVNIGGKCNYTVRLHDKTSSLTADNIAEGSNIDLSLASSMTGNDVVKGTEDFEMFSVATSGSNYILGPNNGNLTALANKNVLLIKTVDGVTTSSTQDAFPGNNALAANTRIILYGDVNYTSSVKMDGNTIEIAGGKEGVTLTRTVDRYIANTGAADTHITIKNLTLSQSLASSENALVRAYNGTSSVVLQNVTFKNITSSKDAMIIQTGSQLTLDGVTFDNCQTQADALVTVPAPGNVTLSGLNEGLSIAPTFNIKNVTPINCEGIQKPENLITVVISEDFINSIPVDTDDESKKCPVIFTNFNHTDPYDYFTISNTNYPLDYTDGGKNLILITKTASGVEEIEGEEAADVAPVYYDVNGVMVPSDALTPGLYICVKGDQASKVVIR